MVIKCHPGLRASPRRMLLRAARVRRGARRCTTATSFDLKQPVRSVAIRTRDCVEQTNERVELEAPAGGGGRVCGGGCAQLCCAEHYVHRRRVFVLEQALNAAQRVRLCRCAALPRRRTDSCSAPPPLRNAEAAVLDRNRDKIDMFLATHIPLTYQFCPGSDPLCRYLYATRIRALAVAPTGAIRAGVRFRSRLQDLWFPTTADEQFHLDELCVKARARVVGAPSMAYFVLATLAN